MRYSLETRAPFLDHRLFAEIGAMILRAGHDTTTNMIAMGALYPAFGITLDPAMAAGAPVVTSTTTALPESGRCSPSTPSSGKTFRCW